MTKKIPLLFLFILSFQFNTAQEVFKTMFYNVLNYPLEQGSISRLQDLDVILNDFQPDLFMICELNNEQGANDILNILINMNSSFSRATFVPNTSDNTIGDQNDLQNMLYYDSSKFILQSQHEVTTLYRDFNHYVLKLNTLNQNLNPIILNVFICHLKASDGYDNEQLRLSMVNDFVSYLNNNLADNSYIILGGDLNIYRNSEPAFEELLNTTNDNDITFVDPANRVGSWHNNPNYLDVFTQSTRTQTGLGGATGGFDDRFDFILTSENMLTNPDIFYVSNSYQVYGNNNNPNCWNSEINSDDCSGSVFSAAIRESLYYMSDHLPVTAKFQTNETTLHNTDIVLEDDMISFLNGNIVSSTLQLKVNNNTNNISELHIFNSLGQKIANISIDNTDIITIDTFFLSSGLYYITTNTFSIKPLKFIKK
ncbi:MAG: hypothetical protein HKO92_10575 [Flavobacteriaceae bacterium]|nr:hypothetical protein [Bacteroidia bacterium]NNK83556.1 hypothetical protein [Flavobacteriaceae bacterium]